MTNQQPAGVAPVETTKHVQRAPGMENPISIEVAYRELQVQYEMHRQRNLIIAQDLANAKARIAELEAASDGDSE